MPSPPCPPSAGAVNPAPSAPNPAPVRAGKRPTVDALLGRWETEGLDELELGSLHAGDWPAERRAYINAALETAVAAGPPYRVTAEIEAGALLAHLHFTRFMATEGWEASASAALDFYLTVLQGRLRSAAATTVEREMVDDLDALRREHDLADDAMPEEVAPDRLSAIGSLPGREGLYRELRELHGRAQQSRKATVGREQRDRMPAHGRLPYQPVGARQQWERRARRFERELGPVFCAGKTGILKRAAMVREWRRQARKKGREPNRFAHFEE
jgi:hypothetical protein